MSLLKNIFIKGVMDKDTNKALIKAGVYRHAENLRFYTNDGDDGIGNNIKGSLMVSDATDGINYKCVFGIFSEDNDNIYFGLASDTTQSKIVEFNIPTGTTTVVLDGDFNLNKNGYITGVNEIDGLLFWAEWGNNPRRINIERAKNYGYNGFTEDDITLAVYQPLQKLRLTLQDTTTPQRDENNIKEKFISFSYRYRYLDGEYSVLAPFSEFAFKPNKFQYDFSEQTNKSMVNKFNQVKIEFNTGSERVVEIQLIFKESVSNREWIIDDFNKEQLGYGNDEIRSFEFNNLKSKRGLPEYVVRSFFDNIPKTAKAQALIDGRLMFANYKENYDIVDKYGKKIELDYTVNTVSVDNLVDKEVFTYDDFGNVTGTEIIQVPSGIPLETVKSNRDYEVKLAYIFDYGRMTTLLSSKTNTVYIEPNKSTTGNSLHVELKHKPPVGAKYFRFFIRQNKKGYDQILPTLFYEDGTYRWVKLEGSDIDKVKKGDYLIVKSDSQQILDTLVKVKVLEAKHQDKNFLQPADAVDSIKEIAGFYIKIKPYGFRIDLADYERFHISTYHNSRPAYGGAVLGAESWIGKAHYYGDTLNDMTSNEGTPSTLPYRAKKRYLIKIDGNVGGVDTFKWSDSNGSSWNATGVPITAGTPIALNYGLEVTFASATGHSTQDEWNVNSRGSVTDNGNGRAYGFFRVNGSHYETSVDPNKDTIYNGSRINLKYDEYKREYWFWEIQTISSGQYDDIEEWFYKENIKDLILAQEPSYDLSHIHFVKGVIKYDGSVNGNASYIQEDETGGFMTMVVRSQEHGTGTAYQKIRATSDVLMSDSNTMLIFETEPKDQPKEIFHEIGRTYKIIDGLHTNKTDDWETEIEHFATDQPQTSTQNLKVKLDWFNAWSFGNAVESYKIKDDFNAHYMDNGIRVLSSIKDEYKEVHRISDITWSDVYNDESDFNGLNTFNLSLVNFLKLDKEEGSIQKLHNYNRNLLVYQEDGIGILPYNKNIIYDTEGGKIIGISTNILNKNSYRPYANGIHGISKNPESFIAVGSRKYSTDRVRGDFLRLSNDGITEINMFLFEHWFSNEMNRNKGEFLVAGYDPKHKEILLNMPKTGGVLAFKENSKGFPNFYTYSPDLFLNANNELYTWKDGVMYRMNATDRRNNFYGKDHKSRLKFFVNTEFGIEKVFKSLGLESSHAWFVNLKTNLTSRFIHSNSFVKKEDFWYSEIMGNTNNNINANSVFGLGKYEIVSGVINLISPINTISVGDHIFSADGTVTPLLITDIQGKKITLASAVSHVPKNLMYSKNQNIDGSSIRGDVLEVDMECYTNEKLEIRAVRTEVSKSKYS